MSQDKEERENLLASYITPGHRHTGREREGPGTSPPYHGPELPPRQREGIPLVHSSSSYPGILGRERRSPYPDPYTSTREEDKGEREGPGTSPPYPGILGEREGEREREDIPLLPFSWYLTPLPWDLREEDPSFFFPSPR
jgi:hypothetical protein